MKKQLLTLIITALFSVSAIAGNQTSLAPLQNGDFAASKLVKTQLPEGFASSRQPVSMSWAVKDKVDTTASAYLAESRGYWFKSFRIRL